MAAEARAKTIVTLDGTQAGVVLTMLAKQAETAKQKLNGIDKSINPKEWSKAKAEYDAVTSAQKKFTQSSFDLDKVLKNLSGATLKQLDAAYYSLRGQMKNLDRESDVYKQKQQQLIKVDKERKAAMSDMKSETGAWGSTLMKTAATVAVGATAITGLVYAAESFAEPARNFQQGLADLSAITGLAGKDLDWLGEQAKKLSETTDKSGIKITSSAQEILRAYSLMGGAKPELLKNKEALNEVTKQALILKEAAGMETEEAVTALANAMNQFNAPASEAGKYINVLAAGAKEGAAEIPDLTASILRSGTAAKSAKVSVEQLTGMVETLGEKGVKGEEAGTGIRNFLLKLQSGAKDTNPAIVGLQTALDNLAKKNLTASEMVKQFGVENYVASKLLIDNRGRVDELTKAVTGTTSAYDQAKIKTATANAEIAQQKNHIENLKRTIGEGLIPILHGMTKAGVGALDFLVSLPRLIRENLPLLISLTAAIAAYSLIVSATTIKEYALLAAQKLRVIWTERQKYAEIALQAVQKLNPYAAIAAAILLIVGAFVQWYNSSIKVQAATAGVWEVIKAFAQKMWDIAAGLSQLFAGIFTADPKIIKRGMDNLKKGMTNWGSEVGDAFKRGYEKRMGEWAKYQENVKIIEKNKNKKQKEEDSNIVASPDAPIKDEEDKKKAAEIKKNREDLFKSLKKLHDDYLLSELDADDKELQNMRKTHDDELKSVRDAYEKKIITAKEADDAIKQLNNDFNSAYAAKETEFENKRKEQQKKKREEELKAVEEFEKRKRDLKEQFGLLTDNDLKNEELNSLKKLLKDKLLTAAEYEKAKAAVEDKYRKLADEKDKAAAERIRQNIQEKLAFTQTATEMISAMQGAASSRLDANEQKELAAAGSNSEKRQAIELKYQQKKLDLEKKYADANMAMQISQVITATAVAVMQAFAQLGPIGGAIAAAMLGITSGFQIASIVAQRDKIKSQQLDTSGSSGSSSRRSVVAAFADGKYDVIAETDGAHYNDVPYVGAASTGIVTRPVLVGERGDEAIIDGRTLTNIRMNAPGILKAIDAMRVPAYAGGRYPAMSKESAGKNTSISDSNIAAILALNTEAISNLNAILPQIKAYIVWQDIKDADAKMDDILSSTNRK